MQIKSKNKPIDKIQGKSKMVKDKKDLRYQQLLELSGATPGDLERQALFHIISRNDELYSNVDSIYDFNENVIRTECLEGDSDVYLSSSSRKLIKLAYHLYNGYEASVSEVFSGLDDNNARLAIEAIKIRFDIQ